MLHGLGGVQWFPQPPQSGVFSENPWFLAGESSPGSVILQQLCSQLGHGELLIAVLQQIGSSVQMTPGRSGRGTRLGIMGLGPLEMLMLFPFQCGYSGDLGTAQGSLPD